MEKVGKRSLAPETVEIMERSPMHAHFEFNVVFLGVVLEEAWTNSVMLIGSPTDNSSVINLGRTSPRRFEIWTSRQPVTRRCIEEFIPIFSLADGMSVF